MISPGEERKAAVGRICRKVRFEAWNEGVRQGRRHGFESGGGQILRAERAENFFLTPPLFGQWGGQNIAYIDKSA